jgi:predicted Zn-dependent peptidase
MPKHKIPILLIAILLLTACLPAQDNPLGWKITKEVLNNGMKVIVLEDHSTPSVAYQVWFHVGSKNERPGITGISHMVEHMMFKGTKKVGPEEFARIIQANGGTNNAFTHFDMTAYHEVLGADKLELAISLEADRMKNILIDSATLASEKQVVAEERRTTIDNSPYGPVFEQLLAMIYNAYPYGWHVIGWMSDIQEYSHHKLRDYFNTYYMPNNATAVIVGDIDPKTAIDLVKKYYGKIKPGPPNPYRPTTLEPEQLGERRAEIHKIAQLPGFFAGYKVPEAGHPDIFALKVLAKIYSGGESSRAYKRLVYDEKMCLAAGGELMVLEGPSLFFVYGIMQGQDKKTADAEKALYEELDKLKTTPLTEQELQKAKNQIEAEIWYQLESNEDKGYALGYYETIRGDYRTMFAEYDQYMAVTADDVMRVAKQYFDDKQRTIVTLIPETGAGMPVPGM